MCCRMACEHSMQLAEARALFFLLFFKFRQSSFEFVFCFVSCVDWCSIFASFPVTLLHSLPSLLCKLFVPCFEFIALNFAFSVDKIGKSFVVSFGVHFLSVIIHAASFGCSTIYAAPVLHWLAFFLTISVHAKPLKHGVAHCWSNIAVSAFAAAGCLARLRFAPASFLGLFEIAAVWHFVLQ